LGALVNRFTDRICNPTGSRDVITATNRLEIVMRTLLVILGIIVIVIAVLMMFGFINIDQTRRGQMPSVSVQGGQAPAFSADVGSVDVGSVNKTVAMPTVSVNKPDNAQAAQ
jgi:hypothetical protein